MKLEKFEVKCPMCKKKWMARSNIEITPPKWKYCQQCSEKAHDPVRAFKVEFSEKYLKD